MNTIIQESQIHYNDIIKTKKYFHNNVLHRTNGPAIISYYDTGTPYNIRYYNYGVLHREKYPANIHFNRKGQITLKEYVVSGDYHRINGPALIEYNNGKVSMCLYYYKGKFIQASSNNEFISIIRSYMLR